MRFKEWLLIEKHNTSYSFSSTQIDVPQPIANKILRWSDDHIPDKLLVNNNKAHGREDEIHVTALYGLHTESPNDVESILKKTNPFEISLGKVSKFEGESYDVIKIDVSGQSVKDLNRALRRLPHSSSFKVYKPHCTIAYVKQGSCDKLLGNSDFLGTKITIDKITFSSKNGQKSSLQLSH